MKATFEKTVDILVKAYLNDTLEHNNCYACAIGNIVAAKKGYSYTECVDRSNKRFALIENGGRYFGPTVGSEWYENFNSPQGIDEIHSTGYSFNQVEEIERAFERANKGSGDEEWMFNGLMAVVDVLAQIHNVDLSLKESAKLLFVKA